jgi:hypothetical protein
LNIFAVGERVAPLHWLSLILGCVTRYPSFISRHNTVQKVGGILSQHSHFKHAPRAQRYHDCGRWTLPCHTVPISHSSTAISGKKKSLAFLLDFYLYFSNIPCIFLPSITCGTPSGLSHNPSWEWLV